MKTVLDLTMTEEMQYYPEGGMCSACENRWQDCSKLDFKNMRVYRKDAYGICVICTNFKKDEAK